MKEGMAAYCIETTTLLQEQIHTLVDNERFANAGVTAAYEMVEASYGNNVTPPTLIIFIYGAPSDHPDLLYQSLVRCTKMDYNRTIDNLDDGE